MSAPAVGIDFVDGVPVTAISVVGMGEKGLLVPTPDGVRESVRLVDQRAAGRGPDARGNLSNFNNV